MSRAMGESSSSTGHRAIDLISAVKELHRLSSVELNKLIRDSENNILHTFTEIGSSIQIDVEKLARYLPLHLIAKIMLSERDEALFKYLLCGIRFLHSLCDLAPKHSKLEQILLDDVKVSEQLIDLVCYLLIVLSNYRQEHYTSSPMLLLHSALVACSLYLLTGCIASQWQDIASVLVSHRKVDIFMDAAFAALRLDVKFLQIKLSGQCTDLHMKSISNAEGTLNYLCQQCEASLQFLQSLCQQKSFRERLVKNKELCGKGGVLLLAQAILNLKVTPLFQESFSAVAAVSRLKSKILSILLNLCEAESISYLDEVASTPRSMDLAKSVALEVLELLKTMVVRDPKQLACSEKNYPTGLLQLNAMRLADIFSDDSNFRSYIMIYFTEVLTAIFSLPHREFLSNWCSSDLPIWEEDATLDYDSFAAAGCVLNSFSSSDLLNVTNSGPNFIPNNIPRASYAHQRASLLVKVIANLHCFVPEICKEEKDVFLNKFLECLGRELPKSSASDAEKAVAVSRNLRSLLSHAESLTPPFLNEEDVHLLRVFFMRLESLTTPAEFEVNRVQAVASPATPLELNQGLLQQASFFQQSLANLFYEERFNQLSLMEQQEANQFFDILCQLFGDLALDRVEEVMACFQSFEPLAPRLLEPDQLESFLLFMPSLADHMASMAQCQTESIATKAQIDDLKQVSYSLASSSARSQAILRENATLSTEIAQLEAQLAAVKAKQALLMQEQAGINQNMAQLLAQIESGPTTLRTAQANLQEVNARRRRLLLAWNGLATLWRG